MGIEVARRYLAAADLVIFCIESGRPPGGDERAFLAGRDPARTLVVRTKADLHPAGEDGDGDGDRETMPIPTVSVAATEGAGMPALRDGLLRLAFGHILGDPGEAPLVTRERHARALRRAREEIGGFILALDEQVPMELAATHLRAAAGAMEDLIGAVTVDDVLDRVFGDFCVGK